MQEGINIPYIAALFEIISIFEQHVKVFIIIIKSTQQNG